jgi:hypothetical protein
MWVPTEPAAETLQALRPNPPVVISTRSKSMNKTVQNLARVKLELARKYESLARVRSSRPARARLARKIERFRRQAAQLLRS